MNFSCLSVIRQGLLGIPLFFLGIVSLAFSQLAQTADNAKVSAEDLVSSISAKLVTQKKIMDDLNTQLAVDPTVLSKKEILSNLAIASEQDGNAETEAKDESAKAVEEEKNEAPLAVRDYPLSQALNLLKGINILNPK